MIPQEDLFVARSHGGNRPPLLSLVRAFRPLMSLRRLRELVIHLLNGISLDDDELARTAGSWPSIEVLKLAPLVARWGA